MSMTVRLNPKTERALNALAKRRKLTRSDVVREAIERTAQPKTAAPAGGPTTPGWTSSASSRSACATRAARPASSSPRSWPDRLVGGVLVDAGPLVAIIDRADPDHEACAAALKTLREPLVTVWPAFTEAMYLLGRSWQGQKALWSRLETGALAMAPLDETDAPRMRI